MSEHDYPHVKLRRTAEGYETTCGTYRIVRDTCSDIGGNNGCYRTCWNVFRGNEQIAKFVDLLREARTEVACDIEERSTPGEQR